MRKRKIIIGFLVVLLIFMNNYGSDKAEQEATDDIVIAEGPVVEVIEEKEIVEVEEEPEIVEEEPIEEYVEEEVEDDYIYEENEEEYLEEDYIENIEVFEEEEYLEEEYIEEDEYVEEEPEMTYYGNCQITAYEWTGNPCANGNYPTEGYTVACNNLPLGTVIYIDGVGYRTVEDRGATWHASNWIDLYLGDVESCNNWGIKHLDVWIVE